MTFTVLPILKMLDYFQQDLRASADQRALTKPEILKYQSPNHAYRNIQQWSRRFLQCQHVTLSSFMKLSAKMGDTAAYWEPPDPRIHICHAKLFGSQWMYQRILWHELIHYTGLHTNPDWITQYDHGWKKREEHVADLGSWYILWQAKAPLDIRVQQVLGLYQHGVLKQVRTQKQAVIETYRRLLVIQQVLKGVR